MNLVFHHVMELEDVHVSNGDLLPELLARGAVEELYLARAVEASGLELRAYLFRSRSGERRDDGLISERMGGKPEVELENLAEIHAAWHAERGEDDIDRIALFVIGHVLHREHAADDALVAVTAGELVANTYITHLRDHDDNLLDDARLELVTLLSGEDTHA